MKLNVAFAATYICLLIRCCYATTEQEGNIIAEGQQMFAMAKAFPRLQNLSATELNGGETSWTTSDPSAYTDLAQAPIWCSFKGVTCGTGPSDSTHSDYRRVIRIDLSDLRLEGYLTPLSRLAQLFDFTASGNKILGGIPPGYFTLIRLQFLNLHNNQLTLTPEITAANSIISVLSLGNNLFEGTIPESLSMLNGLVKLNLGHNMFDGTIPSSYYLLTTLESLKLESNMLTGTIPALDQSRLRSIDLSQNYLTMGSLKEVPLSTFSASALAMDIDLRSNCLAFSNPSKPSQNVTATHCRVAPYPTAKPTTAREPTIAATFVEGNVLHASFAMQEGVQMFAMAKAFPRLQNLSATELSRYATSWTTGAPTTYVDLARAPVWCLFQGVTCGTHTGFIDFRRVVRINLSDLGIEGYLTPLNILGELYDFTVSGNKILGGIPQSFFTLPRLQFLNLHNNKLTLTPEITAANGRLSALSLGNNLFEGTIPESLSMLYGLVKLNLGHNMFDGTIPSSYYLLTNLESLKLESNMLIGTIPALNQSRLSSIDLSQNYLTMGSLKEVPLSTFSASALAMDIDLRSNCLAFSNPSKPSQNVTATHCGGPTARPTSEPTATTAVPTIRRAVAPPTRRPTSPLTAADEIQQAAVAMAEGLELFAMAKAIPGLQTSWTSNGDYRSLWTTSAPSNYTYLAQAPIWCSFSGVECGTISSSLNYRRVTSIYLPPSPLEGYLTPLGSLAELLSFSVNGNKISGTIPQSFFNMPKMQTLHLPSNQLTGSIPPITSIDSQLLQISLENNFLEGSIPESLSMLTELQTLSLSNNRFAGTIPGTLRRLSSLISLSLLNNQLSGTIPVLDQRSLQAIDLSVNYLTMGSLEEVPLSTFTPNFQFNALSVNVDLRSNCLVFRNPLRPSQNVNATHCREPSASPTKTPTVKPTYRNSRKFTIVIGAEGLELFAMAKAIPGLQTLDGIAEASSWKTSASIYADEAGFPIWCSFKGIKCGKDYLKLDYMRVISIHLSHSGLEGYLTPLGSLSELSNFNVNSNKIYGSIPRSIVNLPKMGFIHLTDNRLTGSIPPITSLKSPLSYLDLYDNGLEGTIPESLGMLTGLTTLNLGQNAIEGTIPSTLRRLTKLQSLNIMNNQLSGTIPVLDQSSLQSINLFQNYLTMGSLEKVPLSTFSPNAQINIKSNCLVYKIPGKSSHNVDATHCRAPSGTPTMRPTAAPLTSAAQIQQAAAAMAEGLELFAMAKAIPGLQTLDDDHFNVAYKSWTARATSTYTDLLRAPVWCSFKGVTCGTDSESLDYRRVNSIHLSPGNLEGHFTPLGSLTEMTKFLVNGNKISGTIPQSFFSMPKLQVLNLYDNQLKGSIPPITSINSRLMALSLDDKRLEGIIPESLSKMKGFQSLTFSQDEFNSTKSSDLSGVISLIDLYLDSNSLTGTIPSTLRLLSNLRTLHLDNNKLSGTIPVLDQSSLQVIDLSVNYLTMGSLKEVPLSTFSPSALDMDIDLQSNCLVFSNPSKPSQDVTATHCRATAKPSGKPSTSPTPTRLPSKPPTKLPSKLPTKLPSRLPTKLPSKLPTRLPSKPPTKLPSRLPTKLPSKLPSKLPTKLPSRLPTKLPSKLPTRLPSKPPTKLPSKLPTKLLSKPSVQSKSLPPSKSPTSSPSEYDTFEDPYINDDPQN